MGWVLGRKEGRGGGRVGIAEAWEVWVERRGLREVRRGRGEGRGWEVARESIPKNNQNALEFPPWKGNWGSPPRL